MKTKKEVIGVPYPQDYLGENKIINEKYRFGKNIFAQETTIRQAQEGKIIMYAHPLGNLAVMSWEKYKEIIN